MKISILDSDNSAHPKGRVSLRLVAESPFDGVFLSEMHQHLLNQYPKTEGPCYYCADSGVMLDLELDTRTHHQKNRRHK